MTETVLVAGCSGALGREVARALKARGVRVRALTRDASRLGALRSLVDEVHEGDALEPATLAGACDGVTRLFSSVGASVQPALGHGRRAFTRLDTPANRNLIDVAKRAGVQRFVYVSTRHDPDMRTLDYVRAHLLVEEALAASGMAYTAVRPTGFFSALESMLPMAARGQLAEVGPGTVTTNPIHDLDLAEVCVRALEGGPTIWEVGGPEVLTRRRIAELACAAVNQPASMRRVPAGAARLVGAMIRPFNPRMSHLVAFFASIMTRDLVAPAHGDRRLGTFFEERARALGLVPARLPASAKG